MEGRADFMKLRYVYRVMRVDDGFDPHGTCHGNIEQFGNTSKQKTIVNYSRLLG